MGIIHNTSSYRLAGTKDVHDVTALRVEHDVARLSRHVGRLSLCCQAMWELIRDNTNLSEEDLTAKISEIDLRDGREDDRMGTRVFKCPNCGHRTNTTRENCIMCGSNLPKQHAFES